MARTTKSFTEVEESTEPLMTLSEAKKVIEAARQKAVKDAAEKIRQIQTILSELSCLRREHNIPLNLEDIVRVSQNLDTETDWYSSSYTC
jgi:flagellin-specific chaperone FliS